MEIISNIALISINETLFIQLLSFLIFLFIINRIMFRPLQATIDERESHIKQINTDITDAKKKIADLINKIARHEENIKNEAFEIQAKREQNGVKEALLIIESVKKEINELKEKSEKEIAYKINEAKKYLDNEKNAISMVILEKILSRRLT